MSRHHAILLVVTYLILPGGRPAIGETPRTDAVGDPLPACARARLGNLRLEHGGAVTSLVFSADRKTLFSAGEQGVLRSWETATGREFGPFAGRPGRANRLALAPNGRLLASLDDEYTLHVWDAGTARELRHWSTLDRHSYCLAFSPDSKLIAWGADDKTIRFWDALAGREVRQFKGLQHEPAALAFSPDGKYLAAAILNGEIVLWDLNSGKKLRRYESHTSGYSQRGLRLLFSCDSQYLLGSDERDTVHVWEVNSIEERFALKTSSSVQALALSPDKRTVAAAGRDGCISLWDLSRGTLVRAFGSDKGAVTALAFAPDGKTLASGDSLGHIRLWDPSTGKERIHSRRPEPLLAAGFTAEGSVVTVSQQSVAHWSADRGKEQRRVELPKSGVKCMALSADGRALALPSDDHRIIHLVDTSTGKEIRHFEGRQARVDALSLAPDGNTLAAVVYEETETLIHLWNVRTGKELPSCRSEGIRPLAALLFAPDGRSVLASDQNATIPSDQNATIQRWEVATGQRRRRSRLPWDARSLALSPDGKLLAMGQQSESIVLFDLMREKIVGRLHSFSHRGLTLAFSPEGRWLASGNVDGTVSLWEVATRLERAVLDGHRDTVNQVAFSADGTRLVSASDDGTAVIWDMAEATRLRPVEPPPRMMPAKLAALWTDLAADADRADEAMRELALSPVESVPFLKKHLHPIAAVAAERINQLLNDLDSPLFAVREKAGHELEELRERAAPPLRQALADKMTSLEVRRRLERLLENLERQPPPDQLRQLRAVEVLEQTNTTEARRLLQTLADGAPAARLTREAKASLARLDRRVLVR